MPGLAMVQPRAVPKRFDRKKFFQAASQILAEEFCSLFHKYGYIYKPFAGDSWISANEQWRLTDSEILKAIAAEHKQCLLGTRTGKTARYAVLDIDANSRYHSQSELARLIALFVDAGLTEPVLYRSSLSGGWHLYLFFEQAVPAKELHKTLVEFLRNNDFVIQNGVLEVFPNPGGRNLGHGLRLPLQRGWAWLDSNTLEVICERETLSPDAALNRFMTDLQDFGNTFDQYTEFKTAVFESSRSIVGVDDMVQRATNNLPRRPEKIGDLLASQGIRTVFGSQPPGILPAIWWRGRGYFEEGLTAPGQRADAIYCLGHYLFYGDPERQLDALGYGYDQERRHAIESILAAKNHGRSKDLNRNRADATAQIGRAARWLPPHKKGLALTRYKKVVPISWVRHNANLKVNAIERIKLAMEAFVADAAPFKISELEERTGCSRSTLYEHKAIWHPLYTELKSRIPKSSDEFNAVVGAAGSESSTPPSVCSESMPPGRVAARRVIRELTKRIEIDNHNEQAYIDSIFDRYACSWREKVLAALPRSIDTAEARELKACAPVLLKLLAGAPDEDDQIWLQKQLRVMRERLSELQKIWAESRVQVLDLSG